ncbi:hypothetical protein ONE63_008378 [Megalurothrips usitatus]|uniref:Coactosin-like protein n=1 Tax=Megalurothrips usitatus TaxID=439358 RepID=A0AAV7XQQ6_9NEOP|nr:hypothetical protein ONE63_008378 [Megalurothrips usitatus]
MSSPDAAESQEEIIKSLKEAVAAVVHHPVNIDAEVTANGNGVHHDNGVDLHDGVGHSKPHHHDEEEEAPEAEPSTLKYEEAPSSPNHEGTPSTSEHEETPSTRGHEEAPLTPGHEEAPSSPEHEEAPSTPKHEETPSTPKHEEAPSTPKHEEPPTQEEAPTPEQKEESEAVPHLAVCPAKPGVDDGEERLAPGGHEEDVAPVPVTKMRDDWMARRQFSLERKKEVESQSRPVLSKAAMSTSVDEDSVRAAYEAVRSDSSDTEWAVFTFQGQKIVCAGTGVGFDEFRAHFTDGDRAFGFIRIQMGDEMSKRQKFVFLTWVGPQVSVIRRAKMSIDKATVKEIVKNFAVELQVETQAEITVEYLREQLARAGGANYGTGFRD